jgi:hypothetical protein
MYQKDSIQNQNSMSEEIKITKERILEAAAKCSTAKEVLKVLFPEAFLGELKVKISRSPEDGVYARGLGFYDQFNNYTALIFSYDSALDKIHLNPAFEFSIEDNELKFKKL